MRREPDRWMSIKGVPRRQRLGIGRIERGERDPPATERIDQIIVVDEAAPRHVDKVKAGAGARN